MIPKVKANPGNILALLMIPKVKANPANPPQASGSDKQDKNALPTAWTAFTNDENGSNDTNINDTSIDWDFAHANSNNKSDSNTESKTNSEIVKTKHNDDSNENENKNENKNGTNKTKSTDRNGTDNNGNNNNNDKKNTSRNKNKKENYVKKNANTSKNGNIRNGMKNKKKNGNNNNNKKKNFESQTKRNGVDSYGRLELLFKSMPGSLRSKLAKTSGFGNAFSNSIDNMNASANAKKVLLICDPRFVSRPISTYLITTIRVAGFKVTKCDDIEQAPLKWTIKRNYENENENDKKKQKNESNNNGNNNNNNNNNNKKNSKNNEKKKNKNKNKNKETEYKFEDLDISPTISDFDIVFIPTQVKQSIWNRTILGGIGNDFSKAKELHSFVCKGGVLLLSHFRACEIINGITQLTGDEMKNNSNSNNSNSKDESLKWHETSVRIGKSKVNKPFNEINGVSERARQHLSDVNDIRGILGVSNEHSIYKCDDFTTIGRYGLKNGIIGYIGHDFNAILAKDWNNILFLLMKKQLILTKEYKSEMEMKFDFDIAAIKKLNIMTDEAKLNQNNNNNNYYENENSDNDDDDWSPFGSDNEEGNNIDSGDKENNRMHHNGFEILPDNDEDISDQMEQDSADLPLTNLTSIQE